MLKKVLLGALTILFALGMVGCGGNVKKDDAQQKSEAVVESTPEKAVLAYAQLYSYGDADEDAVKAAGLTKEEVADIQMQVLDGPMFGFAYYSLTKPNFDAVMNRYTEKIKASTKAKVTLKKDDKENPIVELTAATIDYETVNKAFESNPEMLKLKEKAVSRKDLDDDHLFKDGEYQALAVDTLKKFVDAIPFNAEKSIEIPCVTVEKNKKKYWAPKDITVIENFFAKSN